MPPLRVLSRSLIGLKPWNLRIQHPTTQDHPISYNLPFARNLLPYTSWDFRAASTANNQSKGGDAGDDNEVEHPTETNFSAAMDTGDTSWGPIALRCAENVLSDPQMVELSLFSFRVMASNRKINIRLDKLSNKYGSPSLEEIKDFSRVLNKELEAEMGEEEAGTIEIEVSSPGAEREVKVPIELERFREFPMQVVFTNEDEVQETKVLNFVNTKDEGNGNLVTEWQLADTRAGREVRKGRPLKKKDRELVIQIHVQKLKEVNLYLDA